MTDDRPRMQGSMVFMWHWKSSRWPLSQPVLLPLDELYSRHFRQFGWSFFFCKQVLVNNCGFPFPLYLRLYMSMYVCFMRNRGRKEGKKERCSCLNVSQSPRACDVCVDIIHSSTTSCLASDSNATPITRPCLKLFTRTKGIFIIMQTSSQALR